MLAFVRALKSLTRGDVIWHLIWPGLLALALWAVLAAMFWGTLFAGAMGWISGWAWLSGLIESSELGAGFIAVLVHVLIALLILPLIYLTSALIVAGVALPMMLERVSATDYAMLERRRGGSQTGSVLNALSAGAVFVIALVVSLPLWLVPGLGILIPLLLTAGLNRRAFCYDALMMHADREEMKQISQAHAGRLLGIGVGCAALGYIPLLNLFAPAFCGLAFVHYLLEALQQQRLKSGWVVLDRQS